MLKLLFKAFDYARKTVLLPANLVKSATHFIARDSNPQLF